MTDPIGLAARIEETRLRMQREAEQLRQDIKAEARRFAIRMSLGMIAAFVCGAGFMWLTYLFARYLAAH